MAFWGVEVKPDKPITHYWLRARGRLRISQATLGAPRNTTESETIKKTITVQCNVGRKSPVFLCALIPTKTESCHLDLEFEEADDVVFSVIGPRSVYLTGYYVQQSKQLDPHSDTETYGVDIGNTQTEGSSYFSEDDNYYEDSFINDGELHFSLQPPLNDKGMNEPNKNDKVEDKKCLRRQHTKKYRVVDSDSVPDTFEDEDVDDCPLFAIKSKSAPDKTSSDTGEKDTGENIPRVLMEIGDDLKDDGAGGIESNEKVDKLDINSKPEGMIKLSSLNEERAEVEEKTKVVGEENDLPKEVHFPNETNGEDIIFDESMPIGTWKNQMQSHDNAKPKKPKRKRGKHNKDDSVNINANPEGMVKKSVNEERAEVEEMAEVVGEKNDLPKEVETSENMHGRNETVGDVPILNKSLPTSTLKDQTQPLDIAKPRRKRKKLSKEDKDHSVNLEDKVHAIEASANMDVDVNSEESRKSKKRSILQLQGSEQGLHAKDLKKDFPVANTEENQEQLGLDEIITGEIGPESHGIPEEHNNSVLLLTHADTIKEDLPAESGEENQKQRTDNTISTEMLSSGGQPEKKTKRRKKISDLKMHSTVAEYTKETILNEDERATDAEPSIKRILPNGMIIENLANGPPNGKVAALGKRLKICYTAMLKETGRVYDKSSCQFKLGDEQFLQGWTIGIDGMRVGDKRRLTIPPLLGFGDTGVNDVPPNSWVVYDVELLRVRK